MPLEIEESIAVAAPPEAVWRLLEDPTTWKTWWTACREASTADRRPLHDGSQLELVLRPSWLTLRFRPRVQAATPPRYLLWIGTGGGVTGRHAWYLDRRPEGTLVRQQEVFSGPGVLAMRLLGQAAATRRMFHESLRGLKRLAERAL